MPRQLLQGTSVAIDRHRQHATDARRDRFEPLNVIAHFGRVLAARCERTAGRNASRRSTPRSGRARADGLSRLGTEAISARV